MPEKTFISVGFKEKDQAKALGARWDAEQKSWYVPAGVDLSPFSKWLGGAPVPTAAATPAPSSRFGMITKESNQQTLPAGPSTDLVVPTQPKGVTLAQLMAGVAKAVADAYKVGVWTRVEVVKADARNGHVYLELAERNAAGQVTAQARAMIWSATANTIIPAFEKATGVILGGGIKLLVRAKPTMHAVYGLSLVIDQIDPEYTLGDLEAKKREIRARLKAEGLFDLNRELAAPWDFNHVLVVAPEAAAGLGDFKAESDRLEAFGVCQFHYAHARFQGEGAAAEIRQALLDGLQAFAEATEEPLDAIVVIRGGGAVNDLAWLNDYDLARLICEMPVPVFTGIGHERDSVILDEVAHTKFDTPSKVVLGIETVIQQRAKDAAENASAIFYHVEKAIQDAKTSSAALRDAVVSDSRNHLARARQGSDKAIADVKLQAVRQVRDAAAASKNAHAEVLSSSYRHLAVARQQVPVLLDAILERSANAAATARDNAQRAIKEVHAGAARIVTLAKTDSEALMREIAGQGPEKTLKRGFALARTADGVAVTSAEQAAKAEALEIQFHDGVVPAEINQEQERTHERPGHI